MPIEMDWFERYDLKRGAEILVMNGGVVGGMLQVLQEFAHHPVPLLYASTCLGGYITADCYGRLKAELLDRLQAVLPVDGILLPLWRHSTATHMLHQRWCNTQMRWWPGRPIHTAMPTLPPPLRDYGVSKDPCVLQNAVDDLSRTLWFNPAFNTPESMAEVAAVYDRDLMNVNGVEHTLRQSWIEAYRNGQGVCHRCDKPVYRLILADARTLIANNNGRAIQIMFARGGK